MQLVIKLLSLFTLISLFAIFDTGKKSKILLLIFTIIVILLIFVTGFRGENVDNDYWAYKSMYERDVVLIEPSFIMIKYVFNTLLNAKFQWFLLFYAFLAISIKVFVIKKLSNYLFLSLMVFIGDLFLLHEFTQIRAAVAVSFMLLSLKYVYSREKAKFALCYVFAIFFHISALMMIVIWFFNTRKINMWICFTLIIICFILAILKFNAASLLIYIPIPYVQQKVMSYVILKKGDDFSANVFGVYAFIKLFLLCILLMKHNIIIKYNKYAYILIKMQLLSSLSLLFFSQNVAAALRISEFFSIAGIILFPLFSVTFKNKLFARFVLFIICTGMILLRIFRYKLIII
jgi:hypothetical protein